MDLSHNLILLNGEPKTLQIDSIERNSTNGYRVRFKNNGKDYNYGHDKVAWLSNQNVSTRHIAKYLSMVRSNITSARSGNSLTPQNAIGESSILMDMCMREMSQKLPL